MTVLVGFYDDADVATVFPGFASSTYRGFYSPQSDAGWGDGFATGYAAGLAAGALNTPVISNLVPAENLAPGRPGAFSTNYSIARFTPVEFDLANTSPLNPIAIIVKYANRNEPNVALDATGWHWPFDAHSTIGSLSAPPVHVSLMPRGGWPPVPFEVRVFACKPAVEP